MIAPDSKSYPYLALARRHGVSYGDVLSFSDAYSSKFISNYSYWHRLAEKRLPPHVQKEIIDLHWTVRR